MAKTTPSRATLGGYIDKCTFQFRYNTPLVCAFKEACNIDEDDYGFSRCLDVITKSGEHPAFEPIRKCLEQNHAGDRKPSLAYSKLYASPWQASYADEVRHKELFLKMKAWVKAKADKPDPVLAVLARCMLAFNADFLTLERRDLVEALQMRCLNLLRNYLRTQYNGRPEATARFAEGLRILSYARESTEIKEKRLPI